jgi:hypothetical protein
VRMLGKKIEGMWISKLKKSRPPWLLCAQKRRFAKIRFFDSNSSASVSSFVDGGAPRSSVRERISAKIYTSIGTGCGDGKKEIPNCIPETMTFFHGRAGRFGTKGLAITFLSPASDSDVLNQVGLSVCLTLFFGIPDFDQVE